MSFLFRPGKRLVSDDKFSSRLASVDFQAYADSDNDSDVDIFSDEVPNPTWNYEQNMPNAVYDDIAEMNAQNLCDQAAEICLLNEATRIFIDLQSFPLQKIAVPLIAAFDKVCPHPGNKFRFILPSERFAFVSMVTPASIFPPLE